MTKQEKELMNGIVGLAIIGIYFLLGWSVFAMLGFTSEQAMLGGIFGTILPSCKYFMRIK